MQYVLLFLVLKVKPELYVVSCLHNTNHVISSGSSPSQIMALASGAAAAAITPTSGYLVFPAGVTLQEITVTSKDDSIPEPSQFFTVQLGNTDGGARIETGESTASLTGETKLPLMIS